jgi:hypothetical protein
MRVGQRLQGRYNRLGTLPVALGAIVLADRAQGRDCPAGQLGVEVGLQECRAHAVAQVVERALLLGGGCGLRPYPAKYLVDDLIGQGSAAWSILAGALALDGVGGGTQ